VGPNKLHQRKNTHELKEKKKKHYQTKGFEKLSYVKKIQRD
jgi:hypothetical protein